MMGSSHLPCARTPSAVSVTERTLPFQENSKEELVPFVVLRLSVQTMNMRSSVRFIEILKWVSQLPSYQENTKTEQNWGQEQAGRQLSVKDEERRFS